MDALPGTDSAAKEAGAPQRTTAAAPPSGEWHHGPLPSVFAPPSSNADLDTPQAAPPTDAAHVPPSPLHISGVMPPPAAAAEDSAMAETPSPAQPATTCAARPPHTAAAAAMSTPPSVPLAGPETAAAAAAIRGEGCRAAAELPHSDTAAHRVRGPRTFCTAHTVAHEATGGESIHGADADANSFTSAGESCGHTLPSSPDSDPAPPLPPAAARSGRTARHPARLLQC